MSRFNVSRSYPSIDWPAHRRGSSFYDAPRSANTPADRSITPCKSSARRLSHGGLCFQRIFQQKNQIMLGQYNQCAK